MAHAVRRPADAGPRDSRPQYARSHFRLGVSALAGRYAAGDHRHRTEGIRLPAFRIALAVVCLGLVGAWCSIPQSEYTKRRRNFRSALLTSSPGYRAGSRLYAARAQR